MRTILAFDPGSISGAYAFVRYLPDHSANVIEIGDLPVVDRQVSEAGLSAMVHDEVEAAKERGDRVLAVVENVHAMPKQGVSSSFRFGVSLGIIRGVLAAHRIPVTRPSPAQWKRHMGLNSDPERSRDIAQRLFPGQAGRLKHKKDHGRAEALLMAQWLAGRTV